MAADDPRVRQEARMSLSTTALLGPVPEDKDTARGPHCRSVQWDWDYHQRPSQRGGIAIDYMLLLNLSVQCV